MTEKCKIKKKQRDMIHMGTQSETKVTGEGCKLVGTNRSIKAERVVLLESFKVSTKKGLKTLYW